MIHRGIEINTPVRESADVCIIGSGPGGGASAKVLAAAGRKVIVLEEGGYCTTADFDGTEETAYTNLYQQRAAQATGDLSVTVLQGRCVGGSSTVNWTTTLRTPEFVLEAWRRDFGVTGLTPADLEPYFARIERYLNVHSEPDENHNPNNRIILDGARKLGYQAKTSGRNTKGCVKSGACGLGCPYDAKMSVNVTYIPDAVKYGATVFADCRAEMIEISGQMKRVKGFILDPTTRRPRVDVQIDAPVVIVSASAIHSPVLLKKSRLANSSKQVGQHLTFHLTSAVLGIFDSVIYPGGGITQSAFCDEFLNKNHDDGGFWIEAVPVHPALAALGLPGLGSRHRELMRKYKNIGATIVLVKEIDSFGRVMVNAQGRPVISYSVGKKDLSYLKQGLKVAAQIQFAAGARRIMTLHARQTEFTSPNDIDAKLASADWGPNQLSLYSAHPLGTCRMGEHRETTVVDSHCQTHDVKGLFVIDGSVMPTSLGVNPQLTILAISEKSAEWLAENYVSVARG
jgi:choline dehydrogenase-like flavoprotein